MKSQRRPQKLANQLCTRWTKDIEGSSSALRAVAPFIATDTCGWQKLGRELK
jgi:hypothetical protein